MRRCRVAPAALSQSRHSSIAEERGPKINQEGGEPPFAIGALDDP
jgi:hypothetical protein